MNAIHEIKNESPAAEYIGEATYSPEDNKLRLRAFARLEKELYLRVKQAGFSWAPKQDLFVAPMWTPAREDLLLELCGEIGDEDTTLVDRAEERAERFEGYHDRRTHDAQEAHQRVRDIADNIPLGQPILVGHHSERHARKHAEQITQGMRKAVKMWDTAQYWQDRAQGALAHAKYKELPAVRHRRIKGLESDLRKQEKYILEAQVLLSEWEQVSSFDQAMELAGKAHYAFYAALRDHEMTWEAARERVQSAYPKSIAHHDRWRNHFENRLVYERAMLDEQGGLVSQRKEIEVGGRVLYHGEWLPVLKINKSGGQINSITTPPLASHSRWSKKCIARIEDIKDYREPEPGDTAKAKQITKLAPMCNYPGEGVPEITKAAWEKIWKDYRGSRDFGGENGIAKHRRRVALNYSTHAYGPVFITDIKRVDPPALIAEETAPTFEREILPPKARKAQAPAEPNEYDAMRGSLKSGIQVVSAPQLFPTPPALADRMVQLAEILPGERVLEPSAGTGNLLAAIERHIAFDELHGIGAIEIDSQLAEHLRRRFPKVDVLCADFLSDQFSPDLVGSWNTILMNPPFVNGQDIDHVRRAYSLLDQSTGSKIVAIMCEGPFFRSDKKSVMFRDWLSDVGGTSEKLPPDTFESSGTGVQTRLVVITR